MSQLMEQVLARVGRKLLTPDAAPAIERELGRISDKCLWIEPTDSTRREEWTNEWKLLQNVAKDKHVLASRTKGFYADSLRIKG